MATLVIYLFCKHKYIRKLVASLILHKIKEVEASSGSKETNSECKTLAYMGIILTVPSCITENQGSVKDINSQMQ